MGDGAISADHVDAVTRVSKQLDTAQRSELIAAADNLADVANVATVHEFARRLELERKRLQERDGLDRLERQRRNARARSWVDSDGMWNLTACLDPLTGVKAAARVDATLHALFGTQTPDGCPDDPIEKQRYLTAQAVTRLLLGDNATDKSSNSPGRPEFVAVIDADAPGQTGPVAEFAIAVEIPARVLAALASDADIHAVVVRNGVVLHAPGELDLGRSTRLANRAQRRALRGLYRHCAIPGCTVGYDHCKVHHIIWWRNQGRTDLDNLLPVCAVHHANIHRDNWIIALGPNRELTLRLPDGTIHTTGPPERTGRSPAA